MSGLRRALLAAGLVAVVSFALPAAEPAADPLEAERQFRVAQRLLAERSNEAHALLERVVELDPQGRLADDALVELARLEGLTTWVDELGRVDLGAATRAARVLRRAETVPNADRRAEAQLLLGLLRLEPLPGHDRRAARLSLLAVSSDPQATEWSGAARLALAWLHEIGAEPERAVGGYLRVLLDAPPAAIEQRAQLGLGRVVLRQGQAGRAAAAFERAIELGPGEVAELAEPRRELAIKRLLGLSPGAATPGAVLRATVEARSFAGLVALGDGGAAIADKRAESVRLYSFDGTIRAERALSGLQRIGPDFSGAGVVAAGASSLFRLTAAGLWLPLASLGEFAKPSALAMGRDGRVWLLDRKGARLGSLAAGETTIRVVHESADLRYVALVVDGTRAIVVDRRGGRLQRIDPAGSIESLFSVASDRPLALAIDGSGRIAVLDGRDGGVELFDERGPLERVRIAPEAFSRPEDLAFGVDGSLHLLDPSASLWGRWP